MSNRNKLIQIAEETLEILDKGFYINQKGETVSIGDKLSFSVKNSIYYKAENFDNISFIRDNKINSLCYETLIEVKNETTLSSVKRLVSEDESRILCLNFASAKNPGGGFLNGMQAQEESLARSSGLYPCISQMKGFYQANKTFKSSLYTDDMIYSPDVPVFRNDDGSLLDVPHLASFITSPAVNRGSVEINEPYNVGKISEVMSYRIEKLLSLCVIHEHNVLILGAWGCGVFRNDPFEIASLFKNHLIDGIFRNSFRRVVFAVLDGSNGGTIIREFENVFMKN